MWINIKESYPEDKSDVIVTDGMGSYTIAWWTGKIWELSTEQIESWDGRSCTCKVINDITYWHEIPEGLEV